MPPIAGRCKFCGTYRRIDPVTGRLEGHQSENTGEECRGAWPAKEDDYPGKPGTPITRESDVHTYNGGLPTLGKHHR